MASHIAEFVEQLYASDSWNNLVDESYELPPKESFNRLLEEVFWASMESEEGRSLEFLVAICANPESTDIATYIGFVSPRYATVQEFRRLAPATNPHNTLIVVSLGSKAPTNEESEEELDRIVGLIRVNVDATSKDYPKCIVIKTDGPGKIHLQAGARRIAWYNKGKIRFPFSKNGLENFKNLFPIEEWLLELFQDLGQNNFPAHNPYFAAIYIDTVVQILERVEDLRHGGAIILVPKGVNLAEMGLNARYEFGKNASVLRNAVIGAQNQLFSYRTELSKGPNQANIGGFSNAMSNLKDLARFVGELTGSDGAVVLNTDLTILGAGVQLPSEIIDTNDDKIEEIEHIEGEHLVRLHSNPEHIYRRRVDEVGMRHRSSFAFILQQNNAVAFVISQDGGISVVCRPASEILRPEGPPKYQRYNNVLVVKGMRFWKVAKVDG